MKDTKPLDLRNCSEGVYIQVKVATDFLENLWKTECLIFTGFSRTFHVFSRGFHALFTVLVWITFESVRA